MHVVWRPSLVLSLHRVIYTLDSVFEFVLFSSSSSTFRDTGNPFEKEETQ